MQGHIGMPQSLITVIVRHLFWLEIISKTYERALTANTMYRENSLKRKANDGGERSSGAKPKKRTRAEFRADLGLFIIQNNIKKDLELVALAKERLGVVTVSFLIFCST